MVLTNINQTRRGYSYQDKYSLLQVLIFLKQGRLEDFVIDKTFKGKKSVDAEIILNNPKKICVYEIKTGTSFKTSLPELGKALRTLYDYVHELLPASRNDVELFLVMSPGRSGLVEYFWSQINLIKDEPLGKKTTGGKTVIELANECRIRFKFDRGNYLMTDQEFVDFIGTITIKSEFPDEDIQTEGQYSTIMNQIHTEIETYAALVDSSAAGTLVTGHNIASELLEIVTQSSENRNITVDKFQNILINCFARRRYIDKYLKKEQRNTDDLLNEQKEYVKSKVNEKILKIPAIVQPAGVSYIEPIETPQL